MEQEGHSPEERELKQAEQEANRSGAGAPEWDADLGHRQDMQQFDVDPTMSAEEQEEAARQHEEALRQVADDVAEQQAREVEESDLPTVDEVRQERDGQ